MKKIVKKFKAMLFGVDCFSSEYEEEIISNENKDSLEEQLSIEDKRVLYPVAVSNIAFFKIQMLNLTYYTIAIYGGLFFLFEKTLELNFSQKLSLGISWFYLRLLFASSLIIVAIILHCKSKKINAGFHAEIQKERDRITEKLNDLLQGSLRDSEKEGELKNFSTGDRGKDFLALYGKTRCFALGIYILLILFYTIFR